MHAISNLKQVLVLLFSLSVALGHLYLDTHFISHTAIGPVQLNKMGMYGFSALFTKSCFHLLIDLHF